jgi:hypothetical protein
MGGDEKLQINGGKIFEGNMISSCLKWAKENKAEPFKMN